MQGYLENFYNPNLFYDPKHSKSECTLNAYGIGFDPAAFLRESSIPQEIVLLNGTLGLPKEVRNKIDEGKLQYQNAFDIFDTPFLLMRISVATKMSLQFEEATLFLKHHLDDLIKLKINPNVENILMQFSSEDYEFSKKENPPDEFLDLFTKIGIQGLTFGKSNAA